MALKFYKGRQVINEFPPEFHKCPRNHSTGYRLELVWCGLVNVGSVFKKKMKRVAHYKCSLYSCPVRVTAEWQDINRTWTFGEMRMETIYDCIIGRVAHA